MQLRATSLKENLESLQRRAEDPSLFFMQTELPASSFDKARETVARAAIDAAQRANQDSSTARDSCTIVEATASRYYGAERGERR